MLELYKKAPEEGARDTFWAHLTAIPVIQQKQVQVDMWVWTMRVVTRAFATRNAGWAVSPVLEADPG